MRESEKEKERGGEEAEVEEGEWVAVKGKRHGRNLKLFFANFPDYATVGELWKLFDRWEKVIDVYVPQRRNAAGMRFGFVTFKTMAEPDDLVAALNGTWLGSLKMMVNLPRFQKEDRKRGMKKAEECQTHVKDKHNTRDPRQQESPQVVRLIGRRGSRPQANMNGGTRIGRDTGKDDEWKGMSFTTPLAIREEAQKCFVGEVFEYADVLCLPV